MTKKTKTTLLQESLMLEDNNFILEFYKKKKFSYFSPLKLFLEIAIFFIFNKNTIDTLCMYDITYYKNKRLKKFLKI